MIERTEKGKSLLEFPNDYVVIDIEATGFSPVYDSIIEVAGIRYSNGAIVNTFSSLVKPFDSPNDIYIDSYIESLTGITNQMLSSAPNPQVVFSEFYDFLGNDLLVGHNVNFDINFLYDVFQKYLSKTLSNDFIDTMRLSRILLPDLKSHKLSSLIEHYALICTGSHRSFADCEMTQACFVELHKDMLNIYESDNTFIESRKRKYTYKSRHYLRARDIVASNDDFDESHPLFGKICVFTGALERMTRKEAMQLVVNLGGNNGDSVTKKTNFLVLGNNDYCKSIKDGKSSKQKKAEKLKLEGYDIEIIPEDVFYDLINE